MEYLDELRRCTLVDSWSNRYGKSFHLNGGILSVSIGVEYREDEKSCLIVMTPVVDHTKAPR
jgi:hypothetical protein